MTSNLRIWVRVLGDVQDLEKAMSKGQRMTHRFGEQMRAAGRGLTIGLSLPLAAVGAASVSAAADMDRLRRGLLAVAGSSKEADQQLKRLREVARAPGLGFREAIEGSIRLQAAFGEMDGRAELAERTLVAFGNALATAGGGKAELDRVSVALSQIAAKGKVSAEEILQLQEALPQIRQAMASAFGTASTEELQRMGVDAETFIRKIVAEFEKLPKVTGGASNSMENFADSLFRARAAIGGVMLPAVVDLTNGLAAMLEDVEQLDPSVLRLAIAFGAALAVAGPLTIGIGALTSAVTALAAAGVSLTMAFLGPAALVAALSALAGWWVKNRLEAAAFRGELEQLREKASSAALDFNAQQTLAILGGRRRRLAELQAERDALILEQRRSLVGGGPNSTESVEDITEEEAIASLSGKAKEQFEGLERAIAAVSGSITALERHFIQLHQASDDVTSSVESVKVAMDRTIAFTRGQLASSMPPDTVAAAIERSGLSGLGVPAARNAQTSFETARTMVQRFVDAGISFDKLPAEIQDAIRKAFADRAEVAASFQAATNAAGGGGLGLGDLGAALSGIGGFVGGRGGGVLSGLGGIASSIASATNPVTAAIGVFGGAMSVLNNLFDSGAHRLEKIRQKWSELLDFLDTKFNLQDIGVKEQFETLKQELLEQMNEGPFGLKDLLETSNIDNIQAFIDAVLAEMERIEDIEHFLDRALQDSLLRLEFGNLSEEQILEMLQKFKALARETDEAINKALFNVPKGFRVALERFRATDPASPPGAARTGSAPGGPTDRDGMLPRSGGDTFNIAGPIHVHGVEDPETFFDRLAAIATQRRRRGGATRFDLAFRGVV